MTNNLEGELDGSGLKIGIVISRYNSLVTERLLSGAKDKLTRLGTNWDNVTVAYVPGSFELPRAVGKMEETGDYDGIVALGAIIRGETPHFDYVANETSKGLAQLNLEGDTPVTFGLITADTLDQAIDRAGAKQGNKGNEAAEALIEMINLESKMAEGG
ncbi:MAG: 6,7-dimethyl-8-ribityllumazine synthase [Candidatus Bipolaricaulota bacterium]|nr:6,7-dimethyl-8-ribityllumazine synthase [Candidatus Bipolaricaulota bacterium]MBS3791942.1 6,7-dimethyl-8-ribityllumazine synthase [Candidatus Bipolaricaulota bacterium]